MSIKRPPIPLPRTKIRCQEQASRNKDPVLASSDSEKPERFPNIAHHGIQTGSSFKHTHPLFGNVVKEFNEKFVLKETRKNTNNQNRTETKEDEHSIDTEHRESKYDKTLPNGNCRNDLANNNNNNIKLDFNELNGTICKTCSRNAGDEHLYENVPSLRSISNYHSCDTCGQNDKYSREYDNEHLGAYMDKTNEHYCTLHNENVYQYSLDNHTHDRHKNKVDEYNKDFSTSQKSLKYSKSNVSCSSDNNQITTNESVSHSTHLHNVSETIEEHIIKEMIRTEEIYVSTLQHVVENYLPYLYTHAPEDLHRKILYIFGNIEQIYVESLKFFVLLKENSGSIDKMTSSFIEPPNRFDLYVEYSKNKPLADKYFPEFNDIIMAREVELNDHLGLASHLLCPIQRLGKYVLMLGNVQKTLEKLKKSSDTTDLAKSIIKNVLRKSNDFIAIDSIRNCEIDLSNQGSFIMRTLFNILKPKRFQSMVFLFDDIIIFTERIVKRVEQFHYLDSIKMTNLKLRNCDDKSIVFYLTDYEKLRRFNDTVATYVLETDNQKIKDEWINVLEQKLWTQFHEVKENRSKIGYKDTKKPLLTEPKSPTTERKLIDKKTGNATFYVYNESESESFVNKEL